MKLEPEQIQDLPWETLEDLLDAKEDVAAYGRCCAEIIAVDGDVRLRRVRVSPRIHVPARSEDQ